ncbi:MAG: methyltransferase domain-containing protein [Methanoregulaceae archaeon]|nr:methyltransferase domain-containing protein [Methanoregulaceae archaeon]
MDPRKYDAIYKTTPPEKIPWNLEEPPETLVNLVKSGTVKPCRTIDLGCGTGNYAVYLAGLGFDVTGVDGSPTAIEMARKNAAKHGAKCTFLVANLLGDMHEVPGKFQFGFEWDLLHQFFPEVRETYAKNVASVLEPGAVYVSVSFGESDPHFGGKGKVRTSPMDTTLYFSSEDEVRDLFSSYFNVKECKTITIAGKWAPHEAVYFLGVRK